MRAIVLAVGFALSLPWPAASDASLTMRVTPAVTLAPGLLTVRTTIAANPDNRAVEVVADSPTFFRSSRIPLDGERAPRVNNFVFRSLPAGLYEVTVALIGASGRRRAVETGWFQVAQTSGQ